MRTQQKNHFMHLWNAMGYYLLLALAIVLFPVRCVNADRLGNDGIDDVRKTTSGNAAQLYTQVVHGDCVNGDNAEFFPLETAVSPKAQWEPPSVMSSNVPEGNFNITKGSSVTLEQTQIAQLGNPTTKTSASCQSAVTSLPFEISTTIAAGSYITCLAKDEQGRIWIGSEDIGMACLDNHILSIYQNKQATTAQYPLAIVSHPKGIVYIGTSNNGMLRFFNGTWTATGVMEGLSGTRINALLRGRDSSLWIATETGVVHQTVTGSFHLYTPYDGLQPGEIVSLTEDPSGKVWAGASINQIAFFSQGKWHILQHASCQKPTTINQILAMPDNSLWVASPDGIFTTTTSSLQWKHYQPSKVIPECPEDYVTCIARQDNGDLLFGLRKAGFILHSSTANEWKLFSPNKDGLPNSFVSSILPLAGGKMLIGTYGGGLCLISTNGDNSLSLKNLTVVNTQFRPTLSAIFGEPSTTPGIVQLQGLQETESESEVVYLGEDWQTQGDWIGKYGSYAYVLAAMGLPDDYVGGEHINEFQLTPYMGSNRRKADSLRYWTHRKNTKDQRSLQCPISEYRRQSSWDDAGETYPPSHNGPDVLFDLELPPGNFLVSLYFVNIDILDAPSSWRTHDGFPSPNRFRDFLVEVTHASRQPSEKNQVLASTRVVNFGSGVYKRFQIQGGRRHTFRVARKQSHNTVLSAVFIDKVTDLLQHSLLATQYPNPLAVARQNECLSIGQEATILSQHLQKLTKQLVSSSNGPSSTQFPMLPKIVLPLAAHAARILTLSKSDPQAFATAAANQLEIANLLQLVAYPHAAAQAYAQLGSSLAEQLVTNGNLAINTETFEAFRTFSTQLWHAKHQPYWGHFKAFGWNPMVIEDQLAVQFVRNAPIQCRDLIVNLAMKAGHTTSTMALSLILWTEIEQRKIMPEQDFELFAKAKTFFYSRQYRRAFETFAACAGSPAVPENHKIKAVSWQYYVATLYLKDNAMAEKAWKRLEELKATERFAVEFNGVDMENKANGGALK